MRPSVDPEAPPSPGQPNAGSQARRDHRFPFSMPRSDTSTTTDAALCERITRDHARTFSLASRLLPAHKRRAANALYAFCRVADDLVDGQDAVRLASIDRQRAQLDEHANALRAALEGRPSGAIFREVAWVMTEFHVPPASLFELLSGVARDLEVAEYGDWNELEAYCQGVASSVGEMCTHVFGVVQPALRERAVQHARTLGVAMQLTNILRDVGEDAQRGRCYLPRTDLERFSLSTQDVFANPLLPRDRRWHSFMAFQIARARALYDAAMPGIALLAPDAQRCASACAAGYAGILGAIESQRYDTISSRARVSSLARMGILWEAWRYRVIPAALPLEQAIHG